MPAASPTDTPVSTRPTTSPGGVFQAASKAAAPIIVATAPSIAPRRPTRATTTRSKINATIVPAAKTAYTTVTVNAERWSRVRYKP